MSQDYAPDGMTDQEYEAAITQAVASTCHFIKSKDNKRYECLLCREKVVAKYRELNERMLLHYQWIHLRQKKD